MRHCRRGLRREDCRAHSSRTTAAPPARGCQTISIFPHSARPRSIDRPGGPEKRRACDRSAGRPFPGHSPAGILSVTAMPATFGHAAPNVVVLLKDISSTQKLGEHMRRLDRLSSIGTLSASMAHEIKNALVPVNTFVGLLLEQNPDAELAGTVRREMDRVDSIVSRMLKFAGPAKPSFSDIHLHELLEHSLRLVQHRVEGNLITFDLRFNAPSDSLKGDDYQLEQAFLNLLLNAVDAMGTEGQLTVSTDVVDRETGNALREGDSASRWLRVDISDTGIGIAAEAIGSIFDPFFTTKEHGTGLGLAVTRQIIEEHEGVIRVDSQPDKGTTFTVLLPALPEPRPIEADRRRMLIIPAERSGKGAGRSPPRSRTRTSITATSSGRSSCARQTAAGMPG